jgi:hypothetical protein
MQMNTKIISAGSRTAARHPRKTMQISLVAIKHRRAILVLTKATRRAAQLGGTVKQAAANPKVQAEASSAVSSLVRAGKRARRVGAAKAPTDKQVASQLREAGRHASKAMTAATQRRRRGRVVRTTTIVTGAGALGGAAYAGWRAYGRPPQPAGPEPQATSAAESAAADGGSVRTPDDAAPSSSETGGTEENAE